MEQQNKSGKSWRLVLWGIVAVLLGVGALAAWKLRDPAEHPPGEVPMLPIHAEAARKDVLALTNVDPGELASLLEPDAAIRSFATKATSGKTGSEARAEAIVAALQERLKQRGFVEWSRVEPRVGGPLTAAQTLLAIQQNGAERQLYPLEVAALATAALRSVEVPALLAEVYGYPEEKRPVDPSGRFGYFGVFVPIGEPHDDKQPGRIFDAYGGRTEIPAAGDDAVLNDAQAIGAALALRAMNELRNDLDVDKADRDSEAALKLLPKSPSMHGVRSAVVLTVGHPASKDMIAGKQELVTAKELHNGPAQRNNLALYELTRQDFRAALRELGDTLTQTPEYALAHVTRATALLINFDNTGALAELDEAAKWDPDLSFIPQIKAQLLAAQGKSEDALVEARRAVSLNPQDAGSLFILARIEQRLGHTDDVRKHAKQIIERTPFAAREDRVTQVRKMISEDALDIEQAKPKTGAAGAAAPQQ